MTRVPSYLDRRLGRAEEREQVGHLLGAECLLEAFGHERAAGGAELGDLGAEDGLLDSLGLAELQARGGLLGEQSGEDLAAAGWRR